MLVAASLKFKPCIVSRLSEETEVVSVAVSVHVLLTLTIMKYSSFSFSVLQDINMIFT